MAASNEKARDEESGVDAGVLDGAKARGGVAKCSRCGARRAFYSRRYSGESLCAPCFKSSIVEKTRRTISKYKLLRHGERVGVAVSGGKDSLALLLVMNELSKSKGCELVVLTVDEGVAGYREESIEHARSLAMRLGVPHFVVSYEELFGKTLDRMLDWGERRRDVSSCSICGVFRRRAIDEVALRARVSVVATAHNLDDYVQTFMMNLLHGDVERLGWLDPHVVGSDFPLRRIKPFMEVYEAEVALFAFLSGIQFQTVSCPYMHEGLRSEVRDHLNELESRHPGMKNVLLNSALRVSAKLSETSSTEPLPCTGCGKPSSNGLCNVCRMSRLISQHNRYTPG